MVFEDKRNVSKCVVVCVSEREFVRHHLRIILPNPHRETTKVRTAGEYSCIHIHTRTHKEILHMNDLQVSVPLGVVSYYEISACNSG